MFDRLKNHHIGRRLLALLLALLMLPLTSIVPERAEATQGTSSADSSVVDYKQRISDMNLHFKTTDNTDGTNRRGFQYPSNFNLDWAHAWYGFFNTGDTCKYYQPYEQIKNVTNPSSLMKCTQANTTTLTVESIKDNDGCETVMTAYPFQMVMTVPARTTYTVSVELALTSWAKEGEYSAAVLNGDCNTGLTATSRTPGTYDYILNSSSTFQYGKLAESANAVMGYDCYDNTANKEHTQKGTLELTFTNNGDTAVDFSRTYVLYTTHCGDKDHSSDVNSNNLNNQQKYTLTAAVKGVSAEENDSCETRKQQLITDMDLKVNTSTERCTNQTNSINNKLIWASGKFGYGAIGYTFHYNEAYLQANGGNYADPLTNCSQSDTTLTIENTANCKESPYPIAHTVYPFQVAVTVPAKTTYTVSYKFDMTAWAKSGEYSVALMAGDYINDMSKMTATTKETGENDLIINSADTMQYGSMANAKYTIMGYDCYGGKNTDKTYSESVIVRMTFTNEGTEAAEFVRPFVFYATHCGDAAHTASGSVNNEQKFMLTASVADLETTSLNYKSTYARTNFAGDNTYIMQVSTGSNDGSGIDFFTLEYVDTNGIRRMDVVFPETAYALSKSLDSGSAEEINARLEKAKELGFSMSDWSIVGTPLSPMSTDDYILHLNHEVREFSAIGVHAKEPTQWTTSGIKIYKSTEINGNAMYGYISPDTYLDFSGVLMCEIELEHSGYTTLDFSRRGEAHYFGNTVQKDQQRSADNLLNYPSDYNKKKNDYKDEKVVYYQFPNKEAYLEATTFNCNAERYLFSIDLADELGAGMDTFSTLYGQKFLGGAGAFEECLSVTMRYQDTAGNYRQVFIPVTVSALSWASEKLGENALGVLSNFAQQGQSIQFECTFPSLDHVVEWYVCYGTDIVTIAAENQGVGRRVTKPDSTIKTFHAGDSMAVRANTLTGTTDSILITGMNLQKLSSTISVTADSFNTGISPTDATVVSYYVSGNEEGTYLQVGNYLDILGDDGADSQIRQNPEGQAVDYQPTADNNYYLIALTADHIDQSGTVNEITATLHYTDTAGAERTSDVYRISEEVQAYYGYWPALSGEEYQKFASATNLDSVIDIKTGMTTPLTEGFCDAVCYRTYSEMLGHSSNGVSSTWDGSYRYYMQTGKTVQFLVSIPNVDAFTGITLDMESTNPDEYQISDITISRVADAGQLKLTYLDTPCATGEGAYISYTDRVWSRTNVRGNVMTHYAPSGGVLIQPASSVEIDFFAEAETGGISTGSTDQNEAIAAEEITYREALREYELSKAREAYTVTVKVAEDKYASVSEGDTGSKNQFYFQLVFEKDGKEYTSSYVNANQQLEGDGFRSGQEASFTIYTNGDYGDLKQVKIIPDDIDSSSDTFDKLNIDSITVVKTSGNGVTYLIEDVGWIDVPYNDEEADYVGSRTEEELAQVFTVQSTTFTTRLEFAILTDEVTAAGGLRATYKAIIRYKDRSGNTRSKTVDVVEAIEIYNNRLQGNTEDNSSADEKEYRYSDTSYMFLPNRTNRFTCDFTNIASLEDITFLVQGDVKTAGDWGIQNISVRQVIGNGVLRLKSVAGDTYGEYQRDYGDGYAFNLCTQRAGETPKIINVDDVNENAVQIYFDDNDIAELNSDDGEFELATSVHESQNDMVDIQVMSKSVVSLSESDSIKANLYYQTVYGDTRMIPNIDLVYRGAYQCFICEGYISAPLFCLPTAIELTSGKVISLASVHVTQIREDCALREFKDFGVTDKVLTVNTPMTLTISSDVSESTTYTDKYTQTVYIGFAADSRETEITEENDVQVSFRYLKKDDPTARLYTTSTVSLYSMGITRITPNMVIPITYTADEVKSISKVSVNVTNEDMVLRVDRVAVRMDIRKGATGSAANTTEVEGWFNCGLYSSVRLKEVRTFFQTNDATPEAGLKSINRLCPVELTFQTAEDETNVSSTANGNVNLTVWYLDTADKMRYYSLENVGTSLTSGGFTSATQYQKQLQAAEGTNAVPEDTSKATVQMLIPGVKSILAVVINTTDLNNSNVASWKVKSLEMKANTGVTGEDVSASKELNSWVREATIAGGDGALEVNISNTALLGYITWGTGSDRQMEEFDNMHEIKNVVTNVTSGYALAVQNADALSGVDWVYEVQKVVGDATAPAVNLDAAIGSSHSNFSLDNNTTYLITIHPQGFTSLSVSIKVTVSATEAVVPTTTTKSTAYYYNYTVPQSGYVTEETKSDPIG